MLFVAKMTQIITPRSKFIFNLKIKLVRRFNKHSNFKKIIYFFFFFAVNGSYFKGLKRKMKVGVKQLIRPNKTLSYKT